MSAGEIDPGLRVAATELAVSDLQRSADFYERVLGLQPLQRAPERVAFGAEAGRPALVLTPLPAARPLPVRASGLFHVAWLHPSRAALAASVRRVVGAGWRFEGAADHGVSEALYLADPDGLGIEIYADRPRESWQRPPDGHGVRIVTLPLDVEDLLAQDESPPTPTLAPGTAIGHVHLKVADVPRTAAFYDDALGFRPQARLPSAAFLSAGGYHHHVGLNSWQSAGAARAPDDAPGVRLIEFELPGEGAVDALERGLADGVAGEPVRTGEERLEVLDPDGQRLAFAQG
jgi:catechol 2,3-dioxygenase